MLIPLGFNRHNRHRFDDAEISPWKGLPGRRRSGPGWRDCVPPGRARAAARRHAVVFGKQTRVPLGSPVEVTYKFVMEKNAPPIPEDFRVFVHFLDADNERMWTDDHDPASPDDAVEAGADDRIHEDDVRARLSVSGNDHGADGPVFDRLGFASAARRQESRPALLRRR